MDAFDKIYIIFTGIINIDDPTIPRDEDGGGGGSNNYCVIA